VRTVLAKSNSNTPVGTISGIEARRNTTLDASAAMLTAAEYRNVIAAYRNGVPIKLSEIANVIDDVENQLGANYYKNEKSIGLVFYKQSDGNTVKVVDAIYDQLPRYRAQIPPSVDGAVRRPLGVDPQFGQGRAGDAGDRDRAGRGRDLPVPALGGRHHHSVPSGADLAHCQLRGDVRIQLLDQQPDPYGANPVGRIRGR
jgi:hypothetical protein